MSTGQKIKVIRESKKLSQYELASKLKYLNQSQISKIEKGDRKVTDYDLKQIAKALDVPIDALIN